MHEILRLLGGSSINSISVSLFDAAQFVIVLATYPVLAASGTRSAQYFYALAESNKMLIIKLEGSNVENAKASLQDSIADGAQARDGITGTAEWGSMRAWGDWPQGTCSAGHQISRQTNKRTH